MDAIQDILLEEEILTIDILETGRSFYMPLNLNACDEKQFIAMSELLYRLDSGEIHSEEFRVLAVYALLNMSPGKRLLPDAEVDQALSNIDSIAQYIFNFYKEVNGGYQLKLAYEKNHIQSIKVGRDRLYGPKDYFMDVTIGEYEEALNVYFEYNRIKDVVLLRRLAAIFYRVKKNNRRISYNPKRLDENILRFKNVPVGVLYGFYHTFAAFHMYFSSSAVIWEGKVIDMSIIFTEQPGDVKDSYVSPYPGLGLKSILFQLAESGVFGYDKQVRKTNLWEAGLRLYDIRKRDLDHLNKTSKSKT